MRSTVGLSVADILFRNGGKATCSTSVRQGSLTSPDATINYLQFHIDDSNPKSEPSQETFMYALHGTP